MIVALALVFALQDAPPRPTASAQCLVELAAQAGHRLDIMDDRRRGIVQNLYEQNYASFARLVAIYADVQAKVEQRVADARAGEESGALPRGSLAIAERDRADVLAEIRQRHLADTYQTSSCDWPDPFAAKTSNASPSSAAP